MNKALHSIPILSLTFTERGQAGALQKASAEIQRLGQLRKYRVGYQQFHRFMAQVHRRLVLGLLLQQDVVVHVYPGNDGGILGIRFLT